MKIQDVAHETFTAVSANKTRSGLTILGIVIGIASVIAMISIGQGAQASIQSSIQSLGSNLLQVLPGSQRGVGSQVSGGSGSALSLSPEDATAIVGQIANVSLVAQEVSGRYQVTAPGTNTRTTVDGTTENYATVRNMQIAEGTYFTDADSNSLAKVAVIAPTTATTLFPDGSDPVGQTITMKNIQFTIIGLTQSKGGSGFGNQDDMIYIPLKSAQRFLSGNTYLTNVDVQVSDATAMTQAQNDITDLLLARHQITDPTKADFSVLNQADILATASSITQTFTILLAAIGGISLLVGGIGIMNMMLTNVTERTREIGLRKAIGAKRNDINLQFLSEAILLTLIGGIIGILLGSGISYAIKLSGVINTQISLFSILIAFGVSAGIGVVFGYYPARRASRLNPIDALRYE